MLHNRESIDDILFEECELIFSIESVLPKKNLNASLDAE